jgi:hypothetical protein
MISGAVNKAEIYFFRDGLRIVITLASGYLSSHASSDDKRVRVTNVL